MKKPKKRKVLALVPEGGIPPNDLGGLTEKQIAVFKMEYDVIGALERLGHEVTCVEGKGDLAPIRRRVEELQPHIVFNMLEEFTATWRSTRTWPATSNCSRCPDDVTDST